ncbi:hypothetical protein ACXYMZ_07265 [Oceanobacillus sp. CAU 1775]
MFNRFENFDIFGFNSHFIQIVGVYDEALDWIEEYLRGKENKNRFIQ